MGCDSGCVGYELLNDLDFDENRDGAMSPRGDPTYWNDGKGWLSIGNNPDYSTFTKWYGGIFEGNGNTISNLYINRHIDHNYDNTWVYVGLFGTGGRFRNVGLENPYISITRSGTDGSSSSEISYTNVGALVGRLGGRGSITGSWVRACLKRR